MRDENQVFEAWRLSEGIEKEQLLEELVKLLTDHAFGVCWQRIPDLSSEFQWIANTCVWRALEKSPGFKGESKFSTWFQAIVGNTCASVLKGKIRRRQREISIEDVGAEEASLETENSTNAAIDLEQVVLPRASTDEYRTLLEMKMHGLTTEEISEELGMPVTNVKRTWAVLKKRLRGEYAE